MAEQVSRRIRNILVIEDDDDTRLMLETGLTSEGYSVRAVATRDDAISHINQALFQVILMDLCMPGTGAQDFVEIVHTRNPFAEIVLITAADRAAKESRNLNLEYFLAKPFTLDSLLQFLKDLEQSKR